MNAKSLSYDDISVGLIVSFFNMAYAYANTRYIANLKFSVSLANCVAKGTTGQDSDD